jgi:hypothetical protein
METHTENFSDNFLTVRKKIERFSKKRKKILNRISFLPVSRQKNINLIIQLLPMLEQYADIFDDDTVSLAKDYGGWLDVVLDFVDGVSPWFCAVLLDGKPQGVMWATGWESFGAKHHAVEYGGLCNRGIDPLFSNVAACAFIGQIFSKTDVYIVRSEFAQENRAVDWCLRRVGFGNPEVRRAWKISKGKEITGKILSITRPEWEAIHGKEKEK